MTFLAADLFAYAVNTLWQVPLVFAGAWLATRSLGARRPLWEHRLWTGALLLATALPAWNDSMSEGLLQVGRAVLDLLRLGAFRLWVQLFRPTVYSARVTVTVLPATAIERHGSHLPPWLPESVAAVYALAVTFFAARLLWRLARTLAMRRRADVVALNGPAAESWDRCAARFGVRGAVLAESAEVFGPVTVGIRRRTLLLPSGWLDVVSAEELHAAFAHELAHMRRHDFARNILCEVLALPVAWHPLLGLFRGRIAESREMVCDALAAQAMPRSGDYARSLLRLASRLAGVQPVATLHAIGIFDTQLFERRVMHLTQAPSALKGFRRIVVLCACIAVALGVCASAVALRLQAPVAAVTPPQQQNSPLVAALPALPPAPALPPLAAAPAPPPPPPPARIKAPVDPLPPIPPATIGPALLQKPTPTPTPMPTPPAPPGAARVSPAIMESVILSKVDPVYPDIAKAAGVSGTVVLRALIGGDGHMKALEAISGPDMLKGAALDAVRQWVYRPYLLNGQPTEVLTNISVTFSLQP